MNEINYKIWKIYLRSLLCTFCIVYIHDDGDGDDNDCGDTVIVTSSQDQERGQLRGM